MVKVPPQVFSDKIRLPRLQEQHMRPILTAPEEEAEERRSRHICKATSLRIPPPEEPLWSSTLPLYRR